MIASTRPFLKRILALAAALTIFAGPLRAETEVWTTAVPSRALILRAVWGHSPQGVFAVGDAGMILHFDGTAWRTQESGTDRDLLAVWGTGPARVFAAGREGTLLLFDGTRWRRLSGGTGEDLHALWGVGSSVFAAGVGGEILRFDGAAWRPMTGGAETALYALWGNSAANLFAVGGGGRILNYDGTGWRPVKSPTGMVLRAVWGASRSEVFAAGSGVLLRYNGRDWRDASDGVRLIGCLWGTSGANLYSGGAAAGGEGGFIRRFDGSGWRDEAVDPAAPIHGLWGDGRGSLFAAGGSRATGGILYRFDGRSWQEAWRQPEETLNQGLRALWTGPGGRAAAVGDGGRILRFDGASWSALDSGVRTSLRGVRGMNGQLWVVDETGAVRWYDGMRWEILSEGGLKSRLNAVWGCPEPEDPAQTRLVAVGEKGAIFVFRGGAWEAAESGTAVDLRDVFGTSLSDIHAVGVGGTLLHFDGSLWRPLPSPTTSNLWGIWGASGAAFYAVGDANTILHFDGWQWRKMDDDPERSDAFKCVWGRSATDVYAAGDDGVLQHYDGVRWRRMTGGTTASIRKIGGTPGGLLFAVDSDGAVLRAEAVTLRLPPVVAEGAGRWAVQGVAAIPSPRPEDLRISLVSGGPADIGLPASVTIPQGQLSASFDIEVPDNDAADGTRSVRVGAEAPGLAPGAASVEVTDDETATLFLELPREAFEGVDLTGQGRVRMSVPAVREVTVLLSSDNPAAVRVPPSVVIPAGADHAVFDIRVTDDTVIDAVETAGVTAGVAGWTSGSAFLDVQDDDRYGLTLTLAPVAREGEGPLAGGGRVSVPVPFPGDVVVALASDDPDKAVVPATVTIPAGKTAAVFDILPVKDSLLDEARSVLISAVAPGFRGDEQAISILDGDAFWSYAARGSDVLRAVWGVSETDVYAVGSYGTVLHFDGGAWRHMDTPTSGTLYDIWGAAGNDIFAVGGDAAEGGILLRFDGTAWRQIGVDVKTLNSVWGTSGADVYAVGGSSATGGVILHYDGSQWRQVMRHPQVLERVWGASGNDVFAVGAKGVILHFDGAAWREMESGTDERLHGIRGAPGGRVYAAGNGGVILRFDGEGWRPMESGVSDHIYDIGGCSETDLFAVGRKGLVLRYDGAGWRPMESGSGESLWGVWAACPGDGAASAAFAVGSEGLIYRFDGRFDGAEWSLSKPADIDFNDIWGGAVESGGGAHAFAVGATGTILRHDGKAWVQMETGFHPDLNGVWGYAADRMAAVGDAGTILHYDGYRWRRTPSDTYANLNDVSGCLTAEGLRMVAVGDDGVILAFEGVRWAAMESGTTEDLFGVWITPLPETGGGAWEGFAVGRDGLLLHWDGRTWEPMESGTSRILYGIWGTGPSDIHAVGHLGTLLHYDGTGWRSIDIGTRLSLRGIWGRSESDLFVVGASGAVFHFDGHQWIRMEAPSGQYEKVWGAGRSVFVVGRFNFILHYADVGIRLPEAVAEGDGLLPGRGEVFLDEPAAEDRRVTLRSHDPDGVAVPPEVTIPAGALSAAFDLTVPDDALLDGERRVTVTAATPGWSIGTAFVGVADNETAALSLSLPDRVTEGKKAAAGCCRIAVDRPVDRDVAVRLTSLDPATLRVPAAVTIPAGETGASFDLTVGDDRIFGGERSVEIAAHVAGWTGDCRQVAVADNEVTTLTLSLPERLPENAGLLPGAGSVSIPGFWPGDLTVNLASDPSGQVLLPAAVILSAGRLRVDFDVAAADDAEINGDRAVTVTARAPGWTAASGEVSVADNDPGLLRFAADRFAAREASGRAAVTVIREESASGRVTVDLETLDGSATAGEDYSRVATTLVFSDGESRKTVEIPVSADGRPEGAESIRLILDNPGGGAFLGSPETAELLLVEGVSWQEDAGSPTTSHLKGIWGSDGRNVFAVGWRGTILRYDGDAWQDISLDTGESILLSAVWGSGPSDVFAVGADGLILHYDGGRGFTLQESGTGSDLHGVWGSSPRRVFAVGAGVILRYDGAAWHEMDVADGPVPDLKAVWGAGENTVFAVGYDGVILRYDGAAWRRMESGTTDHLYGVWGSGASDVFAVGAFGTILHYDGAGWREMENGADRPVLFLDGVWGSAADDVFAVCYDGVILHYDGSRWRTMDAPAGGAALGAVWGLPGGGIDVFTVGEAGKMLHYAPIPAP